MQKAGDSDAALFAAVWTFHRAMGEVIDPFLDRVGITNGQFFLLFFIEKIPRPTVGGIADKLGVRMSTVTHLVNDLEGRGLVRRERSSEDRRVVRLSVTSRGSKTLARVEGLSLDQVRAASSGIADRRKADAGLVLNEIASRMSGARDPHIGPRTARPRAAPASKKSDASGDRK